jgi:hypothetical protein
MLMSMDFERCRLGQVGNTRETHKVRKEASRNRSDARELTISQESSTYLSALLSSFACCTRCLVPSGPIFTVIPQLEALTGVSLGDENSVVISFATLTISSTWLQWPYYHHNVPHHTCHGPTTSTAVADINAAVARPPFSLLPPLTRLHNHQCS